MENSFYVFDTIRIDENTIVATGHSGGGHILVGLIFTHAQLVCHYADGKLTEAIPPPPPDKVSIRVVKIMAYDNEIPMLSYSDSGHLMLEGEGLSLVQKGVKLFE